MIAALIITTILFAIFGLAFFFIDKKWIDTGQKITWVMYLATLTIIVGSAVVDKIRLGV